MTIKLSQDILLGKQPNINVEMFKGLGWVAGGSIRRWFSGEPQDSDIDLFARTENDYEELKRRFDATSAPTNTGNALNYGDVQLIRFTFDDEEKLLSWFDFSHCQFAWDGGNVYATEKAIIATLRKHLIVNNIHQEYALDSLRRAFKYQRQGYTPCWETLRDLALAIQGLSQENINSQIEISPAGGKRIVRID